MSPDHPQPRGPRTVGDVLGDVPVTIAVALLGIVILAVGSLGPWVTTVLGSAAGTRGDGKITLIVAAVAALALVLTRGAGAGALTAGLAAVVGLGVAGYDLVHIQHVAAEATVFGHQIATVGWGVYVALAGAALTIVALAWSTPRRMVGAVISALALGGAVGAVVGGSLQTSGAGQSAAASVPTPPTVSTQPPSPTSPPGTATTPPTSSSTPVVAPPPTRQPQTANQDFFRSPTGNIQCEIDVGVSGISDDASCQTTTPPASVTLSTNGSLKSCTGTGCLGNGPEDQFVLAYGSTTQLGPFTCLSTELNGMQCRLSSGAGFRISRAGVQRL